ncbi:MAG: ECF transporter S component [Oscillospiraceae bacterium]|nr:ECF transporter S component [Oscillospiraceae bacterium]
MHTGKFTARDLAMTGLFAALVFAGCHIQIPAPALIGITRFHLGGTMVLLAGFMLGPVKGGLAAGLGCAVFGLTSPYIALIPFTFIWRFAQAFVCGKIAWAANAGAKNLPRNIVAAVCGAVLYLLLYLSQEFVRGYFLYGHAIETVLIDISTKAPISGVNAVIAVAGSVPLAAALRKVLR